MQVPSTNNEQIHAVQSLRYDARRDPLRILVIDDDPVLLKLTCKHLSSEGYRVETAANGEIGWKLIIEVQPDLIICDWAMPDISGVVLCERVKANLEYPDLRVSYFILLTAHSEIDYRVLGLDAGADEFLTKPINPYELRARVRAGLRISLMAKSLARANQKLLARNELLASLSLTDQLTNLLNRRAMDEGLPKLLESLVSDTLIGHTEHKCISLMMIDLDHFKLVNDHYGHLVGDEVLKAIAGRLQNSSRADSLLYRYGGEEFLCITPDLEAAPALELAEVIRQSIANRPISINLQDLDLSLDITVSIGIAIADKSNNQDTYNLLKQADYALYRAKNLGRNCTCISPM
ncbi:diguanylate cyclase (GGDEF) domain-containing protein [Synechococcus sp. PCC 7502]|uniref:diguanylate cyclase domain-containing protein n=1 Tax=Synechococcus sp. PCC 7502 TaxID=1173263 RepID=UPI00029FF891|nr:diguanylate cyclase [Synechococcus sp. PCC 7502]AFY72682.1 diguanylate cyclase (GGDEF) domain-containing protein [Synechococcus sp. PCC 7502]